MFSHVSDTFTHSNTQPTLLFSQDKWLYAYLSYFRPTVCCEYRPDMTFAVDWALNNNYLSFVVSNSFTTMQLEYARDINNAIPSATSTLTFTK